MDLTFKKAYPPALYVLSKDLGVPCFHQERRCRHPIGIYNVSLNSIATRLEFVLDELDEICNKHIKLTEDAKRLSHFLILLDALIDSLMEHFDDCENIINCFFAASDTHQPKLTRQLREFKEQTSDFRKHIGSATNNIKHAQGRLRIVTLSTLSSTMLGYFIEGVDASGAIGPNPVVHKTRSDIISFNRGLRYYLYGVYWMSQVLSLRLKALGLKANEPADNRVCDKLLDLARRISALPLIFVGGELGKPVPSVTVYEEKSMAMLNIKFPDRTMKPKDIPIGTDIQICVEGDGVSNSFTLPLYQE